MVRRIIAALAVLLLVPLSLSAQAPTQPDRSQFLRDADRNKDGKLDREEFHRVLVDAFYFRDKDKNGYLVITEVSEVLTPEAFRQADRNGDGRLSLDEYLNALFKDFEAADTNKDGVLTHEEIEIYIRATHR